LHAGYIRLQTHTQNMKNRIAFPLQQWLYEDSSLLRYSTLHVLWIIKVTVYCAVRAVSSNVIKIAKFCPSLALPTLTVFCHNAALQTRTAVQMFKPSSAAHPSAALSLCYLQLPTLCLVLACRYQHEDQALPENLGGNKPFHFPLIMINLVSASLASINFKLMVPCIMIQC